MGDDFEAYEFPTNHPWPLVARLSARVTRLETALEENNSVMREILVSLKELSEKDEEKNNG